MSSYTKVFVSNFPDCDFCGEEAHYDGRTIHGPWAKMCESCFRKHGLGLGFGRGQELVLRKEGEEDEDSVH